jgi:hypothetical protein
MKREISNLFDGDQSARLWAHLQTLNRLAKTKVMEIKGRPQMDNLMRGKLMDKWQAVVHALKIASETIGKN